jgi:outer membrane receptor protein involved in Fe transport
VVLTHKYEQFPGDPSLDYRNDIAYQTEWRSKVNASLNWSRDAWSASLYGARFGEYPKADYSGRLAPYVLFNSSVGYQFNRRTRLSVIVNNLANRMPVDRSGGWPNYPSSVYDIYGRQWWLELDYHFGGA